LETAGIHVDAEVICTSQCNFRSRLALLQTTDNDDAVRIALRRASPVLGFGRPCRLHMTEAGSILYLGLGMHVVEIGLVLLTGKIDPQTTESCDGVFQLGISCFG
jgi:hypothetical protein